MAHAYGLLQRDIPCRILGRDIGRQLVEIVNKMHATNLEDFYSRLNDWHQREATRAVAEDRSPERFHDQFDCLTFFMHSLDENSRTVASLLAKIELMFDDQPKVGNVTLSTVHKAKGLEFPRVFVLDSELMPSKYARTPAQRRQEVNLYYVCVTRAILDLFYISSDRWDDKTAAA